MKAATQTTTPFVSLKSAKTSKIGLRSEGSIHYHVLADPASNLYFNITGNDDDGYYSKELISVDSIEKLLKDIKPNVGMSSSMFRKVFIGQSNNNPAFLAAILRSEKLLKPMEDAVKKHCLGIDLGKWKSDMLKLSGKAEKFLLEVPQKSLPKSVDPSNDLDDTEFDLLQPK